MFEKLSKEALDKVKQAKTKEEALGILKDNGIVLTEEDLAGVAGGDGQDCWMFIPCESNEIGPCPPNCVCWAPFCDINACPGYCPTIGA